MKRQTHQLNRIKHKTKKDIMINNVNKGFTMIEVVIVISVVAILGAVLIPMISQNINSARVARATGDVSTIGKAIIQFKQDTAKWPCTAGATTYSVLYSDTNGSTIPAGDWSAQANKMSLAYHLINNTASIPPGPSTSGLPSWNGPYLNDVKPDPWGIAYVVNSYYLVNSGANVFVLSAGPARPATIDTPFIAAAPSGNDITFRIK